MAEKPQVPPQGPYRLDPAYIGDVSAARRASLWMAIGLLVLAVLASVSGLALSSPWSGMVLGAVFGGLSVPMFRLAAHWRRQADLVTGLESGGECVPVRYVRGQQNLGSQGPVTRVFVQRIAAGGSSVSGPEMLQILRPGMPGLLVFEGRDPAGEIGLALVSDEVPGTCLLLRDGLWPVVTDHA